MKYLGGQVELQGEREVYRRKVIYITRSIGEDDAKYWRTRSIQKGDNFGGSDIDNAVCLPNIGRRHSPWGGQEEYCPRFTVGCDAIRRIIGFWTVFDEAVLVLAKIIPRDILADEIRRIYIRRLEYPGQITTIKDEERRTSMCFVPDITMKNEHCKLNYYVIQFLVC